VQHRLKTSHPRVDELIRLPAQCCSLLIGLRAHLSSDLFSHSDYLAVLHKTASQVRTARARLAERSGLDTGELPRLDKRTFGE
jgi:hypothetical protein